MSAATKIETVYCWCCGERVPKSTAELVKLSPDRYVWRCAGCAS